MAGKLLITGASGFLGWQACAQAERQARARCPQSVICRLPLLYGVGAPGRKDPLGSLVQALRDQRPVRLFTDEYRTPASIRAVAAGLLLALTAGPGVLHLGGRERVSRYEFAARLAQWLGVQDATLVPTLQREAPMAAPRPPDVSLESQAAYALGFAPLSLEAEFAWALPRP